MSSSGARVYSWSSRPPERERADNEPWRYLLESARSEALDAERLARHVPAKLVDRILCYVVDLEATKYQYAKGLTIDVCSRRRRKNGELDTPKRLNIDPVAIESLDDPEDRLILNLLTGSADEWGHARANRRHVLLPQNFDVTFRRICDTGRCLVRMDRDDKRPRPLRWDDGPAWTFSLDLEKDERTGRYVLNGRLVRGETRRPIADPILLLRGGLVFLDDTAARLDDSGAFQLITSLRERKHTIPVDQTGEFLRSLYRLPRVPALGLPPELRLEIRHGTPKPRLQIGAAPKSSYGYVEPQLPAKVLFDYEGRLVPAQPPGQGEFVDDRTVLLRDRDAEHAAMRRLFDLGFQETWELSSDRKGLKLPTKKLAESIVRLTAEGWHVEADGQYYRQGGEISLEVKASGIDWFDLDGRMHFGKQTVPLPRLLEALRDGKNTIVLDDGTIGLLPQEWLKKYGLLAGVGNREGDSIRFGRAQVGLLDALLASMPEARCDEVFDLARKELAGFSKIDPTDPPESFHGLLRPYQRDGLGWLQFLQRFGFGGCLADDMGLGKTVQVLALLESRRLAGAGPSLVVVPRSLIFNWMSEAKRFAPSLRVLNQSGASRRRGVGHLTDYDLVLSTYGTLRKDAAHFKDFEFDYVILDEAQAIKNASTESAKAARVLRGRHRLAMSGTPIENRLSELWSVFEFLNPGMLGGAKAFAQLTALQDGDTDAIGRQVLAKTLRPFVLRRTKTQVATDLPEKTEQTLYCDLEKEQRKLYDELKDHYRASLLGMMDKVGLNQSKLMVLEALLRLRQAACHPGLIDEARAGGPSAKLDALLVQLEDVLAEGHKALVFSQFTSLLSIVKNRLDAANVRYEYLDGKTKDRNARVEHFQNDADCKVFLISLKAGGVGLNLTAADYVFLLDPWWNPAVEAQAIDRTHRIGQSRQVFAYRLIAKDTVEEKVLELQRTKKDLADAIINADNGVVGSLTKEDIEQLLA